MEKKMTDTPTIPRFVVMTSRAQATGSASKYGYNYRNIAVVETDGVGMPKMISDRAKHLVRVVRRWGPCNVGKTERSAYSIALAEAEARAKQLNEEHAALYGARLAPDASRITSKGVQS
jgi:hypothetical protein